MKNSFILLVLLHIVSVVRAHGRGKGHGSAITDALDSGKDWPEPTSEGYLRTFEMSTALNLQRGKMSKVVSPKGITVPEYPLLIQALSFVLFVSSDGRGEIPYSTLLQQVDQLNRAFSGQEAKDAGYPQATDSNIRFKLAGVRYVQDDTLFNNLALAQYMMQYRPKYMMRGATHLNVYSGNIPYSLGLSWYPFESWFGLPVTESQYANGAMIHYDLWPGNNFKPPGNYPAGLWPKGNILTHEVGHSFGLRHPYDGDCVGSELNSDQIDDTPRASGNPFGTCKSLKGRNSCPTLAGYDDIQNYMVATADSCRSHFTPGQVDYMRATVQTFRPTLQNQVPPDCVAAVNASDNSPDLQPCLNNDIFMSIDGTRFCLTDQNDSAVWGWACCPSNMDWDKDACRQGTPNFSKPATAIPKPQVATPNPTAHPSLKRKGLRNLKSGRS